MGNNSEAWGLPEITSSLELLREYTVWVPENIPIGDITNALGEAGIQAIVHGGTEAQWVAKSRPRNSVD